MQDGERLARLRANPSLDEGLRFVGEIRCLQLWPQLQTVLDDLSNPSRLTVVSNPNGAEYYARTGGDVTPATAAPGPTSAAVDDACKHDEDRLAELRAKPSIDAAIRFDSKLRCPGLKPQLPAILDSLHNAAGSVDAASRNAPALNTPSAGETAPPVTDSLATEVASPSSDDACKRDEERLAELQAKPSLDEAVRFVGELKCPKLQPQVLALLDSLSQAPQSAGAPSPNGAPPDTASTVVAARPTSESPAGGAAPTAPPNATSAGETAPPASASPAMEAASATQDDACKRDEDRLDRLRQNLSREEGARFAEELSCERLRPQLLALVGDSAKPPLPSAGDASKDAAAETNRTNEAPPASDADRRIAALERERDALAAKVDRLERHEETPPEQVAAPPPQQPAVAVERSDSGHASQAIVDAERRIAALESEQETLAAEVSRLQRDREASSAEQATSTPLQKPDAPAEPSENQAASQAAVNAEPRVAALELERDERAAEVDRLVRHQETSPKQVASLPPPQAVTTSPNLTPATSPVGPPNSEATASDFEPGPNLASLPDGMPARVLIRYPRNNADARRRAEGLADALTKQGLEVADLRESDGAVRTELRFFYERDAAIAQRIGDLVGIAPTRRPQSKDGLTARPGAIELSFSGDSHSAVVNASRKQSVHE